MPIMVLARAMPIVLMNNPIWSLIVAKGCSTNARTLERLPLAFEARSDIGLPLGFFVWMWEKKPLLNNQASFFLER